MSSRAYRDVRMSNSLSLGHLSKTLPQRTVRIAHCRNLIVDAVSADAEVDYVLLADFDGVNSTVTRAGIESAWRSEIPWEAVTANQRGPYYDIWALRHPFWSPNDCWEAARELTPLFGVALARRMAVSSRQVRLREDAGLVEVDSAFGGLGLYCRTAFVAGRYRGLDETGAEICEHVPFHNDLRAKGHRLFINPALLNSAQAEHHSGAVGRTHRLVRRIETAALQVTRGFRKRP